MIHAVITRLLLAGAFLGASCASMAADAPPHVIPGTAGTAANSGNANAANAANGGQADKPQAVTLVRAADRQLCKKALAQEELAGVPKDHWVLVDTTGVPCYIPEHLKQKDSISFAVVARHGEPVPVSLAVSPKTCAPPSSTPVVTGSLPTVSLEAKVADVVASAQSFECQSDTAEFDLAINQPDGTARNATLSLPLAARTTATLQLGVISSKLDDGDFGLLTSGEDSVITDKSPRKRGPKYVATIVVQALPRYLENLSTRGSGYQGRDMLHDNTFQDKLGLAFSFGIKDPTRRFGLGLSYELVSGINVVALHEWVNQSRLDGVKVGDPFSGAAGDIPTRREWAQAWAFGLTFDASYLTNIFRK